MITTLQLPDFKSGRMAVQQGKRSIISRFINWSDAQANDRLLWLGLAITGHASLFTPLTAMAVMLTGQDFWLIMGALGAMALSVVTNLAALPTRITIPAFFISVLIDLIIVAITLS